MIGVGLSALVLLGPGVFWLGSLQSDVTSLKERMKDIVERTRDERCLKITIRQTEAIVQNKNALLVPLSKLAHDHGCLVRQDEFIAFGHQGGPPTPEEIAAQAKREEEAFVKAVAGIDDQLGIQRPSQ